MEVSEISEVQLCKPSVYNGIWSNKYGWDKTRNIERKKKASKKLKTICKGWTEKKESHRKLREESQRDRRTKNSRISSDSECLIAPNATKRWNVIRNGKSPLDLSLRRP